MPADFGQHVDRAQQAFDEARGRKKVWRLIVWNVAPAQSGLMARLRLIPSEKKPSTFWREYPENQKAAVLRAIEALRSAGLHGVARKADKRARSKQAKFKPMLATSREGFGGRLNAKPIKGSWRRRQRRS